MKTSKKITRLIAWFVVMIGWLHYPVCMAAHYKLFVLTGQSNSLGTTNGGEVDPSSGSDAADQHVIFSWHNRVGSSTSLGHSGDTLVPSQSTADFTTLQDQQGGYYAGSATHWGPEIEFARTLYRAGVRDFGVIKASRGGGGNTNWHKGSGGHMYNRVVSTVNEAVASLDPGDTYEIVGLLYLQGESDSGSEASIAGTRLKELTDNLRADLPSASNMHTIAAGTTAAGGASNTSKQSTSSSTSYIDFFPNLDLMDRLAPDGLHLNKEGKTAVGNRFAQAFFDAGIVSRHYGKLVFIGDSITHGGLGDYPSYRYQVFKNLAQQGVAQDAATGYEFVGSLTGAYAYYAVTTPDVNGQTFVNKHDGHGGWRAFWENGRLPLPAGRYDTNNLGQGTLENWTGQSATFVTEDNPPNKTYTGATYTPDTAVMMIGINDTGTSSATQIRDDIGLMIDQLRGANANVRIHVSQLLHADNVADATVDAVNALLPQLVADKNAASSTSPVWLITSTEGFNPSTMTHDLIHPNALGEEYVGDRIAGGLGVIEMPKPADLSSMGAERDVASFTTSFEGDEIYDGTNYINGWTEVAPTHISETLNGTDLNRNQNGGNGGAWLEGTTSTNDGGSTTWSTSNDTNWTWEARIRVNDSPNGFVFWLGTGSNLAIVEVYNDRTQDYGNESFNTAHVNNDGAYHVWRVAHDSSASKYHVWRDGEQLTPADGVSYDSSNSDERMTIGDYTSGVFGDGHNIDIDYVSYDQTGAYPPVSGGNSAPTWSSNPVNETDATEDIAYSSTLADDATDADSDPLTFSKASGPAWLNIASDGSLTGSPTNSDVGINNWLIEVTDGTNASVQATLNITVNAAGGATLSTIFEGNEIYNGSSYINGWVEASATHVSETLNGTDLNRTQTGTGGAWLEGTLSTKDGGTTTWSTGNDGDWTWEARMRVNDSPNGFILWLGTGADIAMVEIYNDRTQDNGAGSYNVAHTNNDGAYHIWRITHDAGAAKYHVWRDGVLVTPVGGAGYDSTSDDQRLIIGDYTGGVFGDGHNIDIDYVAYDQTGAYPPAAGNNAPTWAGDPVNETDADEAVAYSSTLADDASDPDSDPISFSVVSGPAWLNVASDGTLTGTPGSADVGSNQWTVRVSDDGGLTADATLNITVNTALGGDTTYLATGETTTLGTASGGVAATTSSDNGYETLTEAQSGGQPSKKRSQLEHEWTFNVTSGVATTLRVEAYHTANSEGDDFIFSYSTDGSVYTDVLTVSKTSDDDAEQTAVLPSSLSGTVYIRVVDADRTQGNSVVDSLYVDLLAIDVTPLTGPPVAATNPSPANAATDATLNPTLTWDAAGGADSYDVYFGTTAPGTLQGNQTGTSFTPGTLLASTTYFWRVDSVNGNGTTTGTVWSFTTGAGGSSALFSDDFEDGNVNGWATTGTVAANTAAANTGVYGAKLRATASMTISVDTTGVSAVDLEYDRSTAGFDAGETLTVEWSTDGSNWNTVESTSDANWATTSVTLPAGAAGQAALQIRFSTNANRNNENGYVDNITVSGN